MSNYAYDTRVKRITGERWVIEEGIRNTIIAGALWLAAHPDCKPTFAGTRYIGCGNSPSNKDAKDLLAFLREEAAQYGNISQDLIDGACVHVLFANENGWDAYQNELCGKGAGTPRNPNLPQHTVGDDSAVKLEGVRYGAEDLVLVLENEFENAPIGPRLQLRASNQGGHDWTTIDLLDLLAWVKKNAPELLKDA